jgi:hypothetical protein
MDNGPRVLFLALLMATSVSLVRVKHLSRAVDAARSESRARADSVAFASAERRVLLSHLNTAIRVNLDSTALLRGINVATGDSVSLSARDLDLIYVIATQCKNCQRNFPLLRRLHQAGRRIVVISGSDTPASLRAYAREHAIPFVVIGGASGPMFRLLRTGPTPVTVAFRDGLIADLRIGNLTRAFPEFSNVGGSQ